MPPLVYLDTCCLNRPSDDQTQPRVRLESEAVLTILTAVEARRGVEWLGSTAVLGEVRRNPDPDRRRRALQFLRVVTRWVQIEPGDGPRSEALAQLAGLTAFDALHVALAERGRADVLLTTDDRLLRRAARHAAALRVQLENPLTWLARTFPAGISDDE
jgi:predicted nucleic acid-binding protein